ncbi:ABC transporter [Mycolicibacterium acapulense]|nr:ABC transporter [Mycolicibacterium acapulense]KUI05249.1 ABC transporter [Mycolicibacterium acapulense]
MSIALATSLKTSFDDAVARTREALADQGFGVLTEIDVKATLKNKLGEDMESYLILGACNPPLAHRAINAQRQVGLLLPCNVVVRSDPEDPETTLVEAMNPQLLVDVTEEPSLKPIAEEVGSKLAAVIDTLSQLT